MNNNLEQKVNTKYCEILCEIKELENVRDMYANKEEFERIMLRLRNQQYLLEEILNINQ